MGICLPDQSLDLIRRGGVADVFPHHMPAHGHHAPCKTASGNQAESETAKGTESKDKAPQGDHPDAETAETAETSLLFS